MKSDFITQSLAIVKEAGDYEKAYPLYKRAPEYFLTITKYEKSTSAREVISARVTGYMKRARTVFFHTKLT